MATHRAERLAEMIHREVAVRLRTEMKDPRIGEISITRVEVARDLEHAKIVFLRLGGGAPSREQKAALADAAKALRGPVGRALRLRRAPELVFTPDVHFEDAVRVASLISRLERERAMAEAPPADPPADGDEGEQPGDEE